MQIFVCESPFIGKLRLFKNEVKRSHNFFEIVLQTGMILCLCIRVHASMNGGEILRQRLAFGTLIW